MFGVPGRSRLLPMSVPFRYFGSAIAFQVLAWALLLFQTQDLADYQAGLGPLFATLHVMTLGVLTMTAVGATLQLFPVATRQAVRSVGIARLVWWLLTPGVLIFAAGAAPYRPLALGSGAAIVVVALALYAWLFFRTLKGARGMPVIVAHGWGALAALLGALAIGCALAGGYVRGFALDYAALRPAHMILATYGFMGLLAMGLSQLLLPMFAVAPPPRARIAYVALSGAAAGIAAAAAGFIAVGAMLGLAAASLHVFSLECSLRARLRHALDPGFLLVRAAWACLLASLVVGAGLAFDLLPPHAAALFGVLLVPGWLLTFLLGVLQRIVPFLASVHASSAARGTPLASAMTPGALLQAHRILHLAALAALIAGVAAGESVLVRAGAAAGLAGALAYAAFFAFVLFKVRHHGTASRHQPASA